MPTLDERQERLKQLQTFLDTTDDDDARAEASLLHRRLTRLDDALREVGGRVALIGPPGVGKSSVLAALAGLYVRRRSLPRTVEAQRAEALVTVGGGRSTAFPIVVRAPHGEEPPDRLSLVIRPMSPQDTRRLVQDVAAQELHELRRRSDTDSRRAVSDTDSRPDPVGEELRRAVLNAAGYPERVEITYEGNLKRTRRVRPLEAVVTLETPPDDLTRHLLDRLGQRAPDRWTFDDTPEGRAALRSLFDRVNLGEEPGAALPDQLELALPAMATGDAPLELIDTRGLDGPLAVRSDLREPLNDPRTVPVLCGTFNNAPGEELLQALRVMYDDPALRPALGRATVLLVDKGEAAAVVGAEGAREFGQAIKEDQCWDRLPQAGLERTALRAFDPLLDDGEALLTELRGRVALAREALEGEAREVMEDAARLLDGAQRALGAALDEVLALHLRAHMPPEAPTLEPAAAMGAELRACPFALRILAALRWQGTFPNLHLIDAAEAAARSAADRWLAPTREALLARLDELSASYNADLIRTRRAALTRALEQTVRDYGEAVRAELDQLLKGDRVWEDAADEYKDGRGFRERAASQLDRWAARQPLRAHRQTRLAEHLPIYRRVQAPAEAPGFTLVVENLRRLRAVRWPLQGVNLLIGANGSGKSTALTALRFFAEALRDGPGAACARLGAARTLRSWGAPADAPVTLALEKGRTRWAFTLISRDTDRAAAWRETLSHHGEEVLEVNEAGRLRYRGEDMGSVGAESGLGHLLRAQKVDLPLTRMADLAGGVRAHRVFNLHQLKAGGTAPLPERPLEDDGGNAFAVLHALRSAPGGQARYDFVLDSLRLAFPNLIEELTFRLTEHNIEVSVIAPGGQTPLYIGQQADGLLQYLVNLVAVASARPGDVVALDQPEDGLHPYAAKTLLASVEDWAWKSQLTVVIATHSLVLLNEQGGTPGRVFVMKAPKDGEPSPAPLTALFNEDWLQGFTLGDLYATENFGSNADEG